MIIIARSRCCVSSRVCGKTQKNTLLRCKQTRLLKIHSYWQTLGHHQPPSHQQLRHQPPSHQPPSQQPPSQQPPSHQQLRHRCRLSDEVPETDINQDASNLTHKIVCGVRCAVCIQTNKNVLRNNITTHCYF